MKEKDRPSASRSIPWYHSFIIDACHAAGTVHPWQCMIVVGDQRISIPIDFVSI